MSVKVKYKGAEIFTSDTDESRKLLTGGKYLEGDIIVENKQDGGITPTGSINITENGTYDVTDKAEAVVEVQGGGFDFLGVVTTLQMTTANLPEIINLDLPKATNLNNCFMGTSGVQAITINAPLLTQQGGCFNNSSIKSITYLTPTRKCINFGQAFFSTSITDVYGLDFRSQTSNLANTVFNRGLKNIEIVANTINVNISFGNTTQLTIESLVNIANALVEGSHTLSLSSTSKDLCNTIYVTYSTVEDDTGTYNKSGIAESGGITLTNFITQVKGWTIA